MLLGILMLYVATGTFRFAKSSHNLPVCKSSVYSGDASHSVRGFYEICAISLPYLATGCDGGTDTDKRLPAFRYHGEGRHVSRSPTNADIRWQYAWFWIVTVLGIDHAILGLVHGCSAG